MTLGYQTSKALQAYSSFLIVQTPIYLLNNYSLTITRTHENKKEGIMFNNETRINYAPSAMKNDSWKPQSDRVWMLNPHIPKLYFKSNPLTSKYKFPTTIQKKTCLQNTKKLELIDDSGIKRTKSIKQEKHFNHTPILSSFRSLILIITRIICSIHHQNSNKISNLNPSRNFQQS